MKSRPKIFVLAILGVIILILVALLVYVLVSGKLYIGVKDNKQTVAVYNKGDNVVCGQDIVDKYLGVVDNPKGYSSDALDALTDEIKSKPHYQDEAVCNYVVFHRAIIKKDYDNVDNLKDILDKSLDKPQSLKYAYDIGLSSSSVNRLMLIKNINSESHKAKQSNEKNN